MTEMNSLNLMDHPEGGRYCQVFKSAKTVTTSNGDSRSALSHIYFSLDRGELSLFHKVSSDEVWNLYKGTGVTLYLWDGSSNAPSSITLSAQSGHYCHVVPAGMWQAAEPIDDTVLVGCSVAPGFEFSDFELISPESEHATIIADYHPAFRRFITSPKSL